MAFDPVISLVFHRAYLFAGLRVEAPGWVIIGVGVRFEGDSGFDTASVHEAVVTREFYADVAEALLSCYHIAGVRSLYL